MGQVCVISLLNNVQSHAATQSQATPETKAANQASSQQQAASDTASTHSAASVPTDTVTISSAAQAAQKELSETPAQTAIEASGGDRQAQRLLAKEAADHQQ